MWTMMTVRLDINTVGIWTYIHYQRQSVKAIHMQAVRVWIITSACSNPGIRWTRTTAVFTHELNRTLRGLVPGSRQLTVRLKTSSTNSHIPLIQVMSGRVRCSSGFMRLLKLISRCIGHIIMYTFNHCVTRVLYLSVNLIHYKSNSSWARKYNVARKYFDFWGVQPKSYDKKLQLIKQNKKRHFGAPQRLPLFTANSSRADSSYCVSLSR